MDSFQLQQEYVVITFDDGSCRVMSFVTIGRGPSLPPGGEWLNARRGIWKRAATKFNVDAEITRTAWGDGPQPLTWRMGSVHDAVTPVEYRGARVDDGKRVVHDMAKAREIHMGVLRQQRESRFLALDAKWMKHYGRGEVEEAAAVEAKRQALRDLPHDAVAGATDLVALQAVRLPD